MVEQNAKRPLAIKISLAALQGSLGSLAQRMPFSDREQCFPCRIWFKAAVDAGV